MKAEPRTPTESARNRARAHHGQATADGGGYQMVLEKDPRYPAGRWRRRHRGNGKRGAPAAATVDRFEVLLALDTLRRADELLTAAAAMPAGPARKAAHAEALAQVGLAGRACDAVILRRGGELT